MLTGCGVATRWIRRICELRGPGRPYPPPGRTEEADQDGDKRHSAPLEAPWRADARQLPHEQAEVGATDAEMGVPDHVIESITGHLSRRMLEHYSHVRLAAKRHALEALDARRAEPDAAEAHAKPETFE